MQSRGSCEGRLVRGKRTGLCMSHRAEKPVCEIWVTIPFQHDKDARPARWEAVFDLERETSAAGKDSED